jgi:hypothetical protein
VNGPIISYALITYVEFYDAETSFGVDIDGDSKIGLQFIGNIMISG